MDVLTLFDETAAQIDSALRRNEVIDAEMLSMRELVSQLTSSNRALTEELGALRSSQLSNVLAGSQISQLVAEKATLEQQFVARSREADEELAKARGGLEGKVKDLANEMQQLMAFKKAYDDEKASKAELTALYSIKENALLARVAQLSAELDATRKAAADANRAATAASEQLDATMLALQQKNEDEASARREAEARGAALEMLRAKHEALLSAIEANRAKRQAEAASAAQQAAAAASGGTKGRAGTAGAAGKFAPRR